MRMKKMFRLLNSLVEIIGYIAGGAPARVPVRVQRYGIDEDREQHTINREQYRRARQARRF